MNRYSRDMRDFDIAHSFIVRIWRERGDEEHIQNEWRGWIDHLPSRQRLYFRDLDEIGHFVLSCLETAPPLSRSDESVE